ncbi:MAG: peptidylprolyl isomerase [Lachnospirales bacterium]
MKKFIKLTTLTIMSSFILSSIVSAEETSLQEINVKALYTLEDSVLNTEEPLSLYAYNDNDTKYYRLRDIASILDYLGYKNNLVWDQEKKSIVIDFSETYEYTGVEYDNFEDTTFTVKEIETTLYAEDDVYTLDTLNINGNNFYSQEDIAELYQIGFIYNDLLDINVIYLLETAESVAENIALNQPYTDQLYAIKEGNTALLQFEEPAEGDTIATIETNYGNFSVKFLPEYAPKAVENFITLSKEGYYDGTIFHRVIEDFVIQGGDPTGTGTGGESIWGEPFENEINANAHHFTGALAMANAGEDTNGSQFYIVPNTSEDYLKNLRTSLDALINEVGLSEMTYSDAYLNTITAEQLFTEEALNKYKEVGGMTFLDYGYTIFGQVIDGQEVVDSISLVETDSSTDKPLEDVIIEKITISEYKK